MTEPLSLAAAYDRVAAHLVGRERELTLLLAAVAAGRDIILEGPPGTSKSTLLRAITAEWGIPLFFVEGNADLTPSKLIGHHNPARVLREDYSPDNFVDGPLLQAMRAGGFLYIEEFNRAPEDTLNTLLTAMAEREIAVPTAGIVPAKPTFRVVASMNPYDNVGATRLSTSVHDRICRLAIGYQDAAAERGIVALRAPLPELAPELYGRLVADAVAVTRATREHPDIRTSGRAAACAGPSTSPWWPGSCSSCAALRRPEGTPSWCTTRWWWPCPGGSSWTRPSTPRRRRCCGRSGRTSSSWSRPRRRLVEERCLPTRRCGGPGPYGRRGWRRCGGGPSSSTRTRGCSRRAAAGPGAWS